MRYGRRYGLCETVGGAPERGAIEGEAGHQCKCSHPQRLCWLSCQGDREKGACGDVPKRHNIQGDSTEGGGGAGRHPLWPRIWSP